MSCDPTTNGFEGSGQESDYITDPSGEPVTKTTMDEGVMVWNYTNVYANGQLFATYDAQGLHFQLNDWLGTRRETTNYAGVVEQTCASLPYGDGMNCTGSPDAPNEQHFTGKIHDSESGLDYFGARYYSSNDARFLTPDWSAKVEPVPYAKLGDPQSLNLYDYLGDNPLSGVDPDGHILQCQPSGSCPQSFKEDLAKLAPGTKVGSNGTVQKGGLIRRVWNHLSGHGEGQALITALVDSRSTTTINAGPQGSASTVETAAGATVTVDPQINVSIPTRTGGDQVSNQPVDPAVVLGHELIHAYHDVTGTAAEGYSVHDFTANGHEYHEVWKTEEFNTVGFGNVGGPTENGLRHELHEDPRASYLGEESWQLGW